jgi:hypothetical protein
LRGIAEFGIVFGHVPTDHIRMLDSPTADRKSGQQIETNETRARCDLYRRLTGFT